MSFTIEHSPQPADHFRIVSNDFLRGKFPVPLKALERALLGYFMSLPNGWRMDRAQLDRSVVEGRDAVTKALNALEDKGYLRRSRSRSAAGEWSWSWRVTVDPIKQPLPESPSTESQSMDATSGNITKPQVAPSTENPSTENQSILEDGVEKTDQKIDGTPSGTCSRRSPASRPSGIKKTRKLVEVLHGGDLVGLSPQQLTQKLTAVWHAVLKQHGGEAPTSYGGGWREARDRHPLGAQLKDFFHAYDPEDYVHDEEWLNGILGRVRAHARQYARNHPQAAAEAA